MSAEEELVSRYKTLIRSGCHHNPYCKNRGHWISEINTKIKQLEQSETRSKKSSTLRNMGVNEAEVL